MDRISLIDLCEEHLARLVAGDRSWEAVTGDVLIIPDARHGLESLEDTGVLLTVGKR